MAISATPSAVGTRRRRSRRGGTEASKARAGWLLLAPALLLTAVFTALPAGLVILISLVDFRFGGDVRFVGLENYRDLFANDRFGVAVVNTVIYTLAVVPGGMFLALLVALGLNQPLRGRPLFRTLFYIPVVTSTVAVSTVWLWVYNPSSGIANEVLAFLGVRRSGWLTDPDIALPALIAVGIWQGLGTKIVLYLGGLQSISADLLEAARLDGASTWQTFWNVTWPGLAPVQAFVLITSIAGSFQAFDLVYVMTQGGPINSTRVLAYDIFDNAFGSFKFGLASAETVVMLVVVGVFIYGARLLQRGEN